MLIQKDISLSEKCMTWATEVRGERLRELFSSLESVAEKAHFKTRQYQLRMRSPWQRMPYIAMVCESHLKEDGDFKDSYRRVSHVWNAEEETMLPMEQILKMFCVKNDSKTLGFHPDGVYPENDAIVFYKNEGKNNDFMEVRRNFGKA